jgi:hypothetical protein
MVPWSPHQTSKMRPYLGLVVCPYGSSLHKPVLPFCWVQTIFIRRLCSPTMFRLTRPDVSTVRIRWSSYCSCGHLSKKAPTTGQCTFGVAQEPAARGRVEGTFLMRNKLAETQEKAWVCYSIRAWRGLHYNEKYASKLERQLARKRQHGRAPPAPLEGHKSAHQDVNPFAVRCGQRWESVSR